MRGEFQFFNIAQELFMYITTFSWMFKHWFKHWQILWCLWWYDMSPPSERTSCIKMAVSIEAKKCSMFVRCVCSIYVYLSYVQLGKYTRYKEIHHFIINKLLLLLSKRYDKRRLFYYYRLHSPNTVSKRKWKFTDSLEKCSDSFFDPWWKQCELLSIYYYPHA